MKTTKPPHTTWCKRTIAVGLYTSCDLFRLPTHQTVFFAKHVLLAPVSFAGGITRSAAGSQRTNNHLNVNVVGANRTTAVTYDGLLHEGARPAFKGRHRNYGKVTPPE